MRDPSPPRLIDSLNATLLELDVVLAVVAFGFNWGKGWHPIFLGGLVGFLLGTSLYIWAAIARRSERRQPEARLATVRRQATIAGALAGLSLLSTSILFFVSLYGPAADIVK